MIAVAQNDRERALQDARRAVELSPRSAAAKITLSYAEQARFRIAGVPGDQQAVQDEPENPLANAGPSRPGVAGGEAARKLAPS